MKYEMTDRERKYAKEKGWSETEYWFHRAKDAEAQVETLEDLLEGQEK